MQLGNFDYWHPSPTEQSNTPLHKPFKRNPSKFISILQPVFQPLFSPLKQMYNLLKQLLQSGLKLTSSLKVDLGFDLLISTPYDQIFPYFCISDQLSE